MYNLPGQVFLPKKALNAKFEIAPNLSKEGRRKVLKEKRELRRQDLISNLGMKTHLSKHFLVGMNSVQKALGCNRVQ